MGSIPSPLTLLFVDKVMRYQYLSSCWAKRRPPQCQRRDWYICGLSNSIRVASPDSSLKLASRRADGGLKISCCCSSLIGDW